MDPVSVARAIVDRERKKADAKPLCSCKPRPRWWPRILSRCGCVRLPKAIAIYQGVLVMAADARVPADCCWRHAR